MLTDSTSEAGTMKDMSTHTAPSTVTRAASALEEDEEEGWLSDAE